MEQPDFLVIGHVSKDLTEKGYQPGGTALYSALTAQSLGRRVAVITSVGPDLDLSPLLGDIEAICLPSRVTTTFRNVCEDGGRRQYVYAVADRIGAADVPDAWTEVAIVHLGPIAGEIQAEMIDLFSSSLLGLTPQGWLRQWDEQGRVFPCQWTQADKFLSSVDALVLSEEDLVGEAQTLRSQLGHPRVSVVTEGAKGATVYYRGAKRHFPARRTETVDRTGAGDIFAAAFFIRLAETDNPHEAAGFASVAASLSVEKKGIASIPNRAQIEALDVNWL